MTRDFFNKVIILSDFDGTFRCSSTAVVPEKNVAAVKKFISHGGHFTLSTGRLPSIMREIYPEFTETVNLPLIMSNGAMLCDYENGSIISSETLPAEIAKEIILDVTERFLPFLEDWVVYDEQGIIRHKPCEDILNGNSFFYKMRFNAFLEKDAIAVRDYVSKMYFSHTNVFRSWNTCTEVVTKSASKERMVHRLAGYVQEKFNGSIPADDLVICAIGDYENDISLLESADYAFCPSCAIDSVKDKCNYVLCDASEGAVAQMIDIIEKNLTDGNLR